MYILFLIGFANIFFTCYYHISSTTYVFLKGTVYFKKLFIIDFFITLIFDDYCLMNDKSPNVI